MRILIAEDDGPIRAKVADALAAAGFVVDVEADGEEAWFLGDTEIFDAVILDLGLPGMDGLSILSRWRAAGRDMPVLILTARGRWSERVIGIDAGADDYLPKPFEIDELLARLRAILRRSAGHAASRIEVGAFVLDTRQMQVLLDGKPVPLTPQEYRLAAFLIHQRGRVVGQQELAEHLQSVHSERESNAVEVLVGRLRRKLGAPLIETRRGFGYIVPAK